MLDTTIILKEILVIETVSKIIRRKWKLSVLFEKSKRQTIVSDDTKSPVS